MNTFAKTCVKLTEERPPEGTYQGKWSGYVVRLEAPQGKYEITTGHGVRGIDIPCFVTVKEDGAIIIEL
jgi:hypothetical protein